MVSRIKRIIGSAALGWLALAFVGSNTGAASSEPAVAHAAPDPNTRVLDLQSLYPMGKLVDQLAGKRIVYVGESHDRYEDHLNQLAVIEGLFQRNRDLAIGMEFFQQPFQVHLDRYVGGEISEEDLLSQTEYFNRWRFDYRLYQPILRFARENRIPLIALNLPEELTKKVGDVGIDGLSAEEARQIPEELDRSDEAYRERVRRVFEHHPKSSEANFEHFYEVQLLWDEGMAERAAAYLEKNPDKQLVVLAGSGHLEFGQGIPKRLARRVSASSAIVLAGSAHEVEPGVADYLLFPEPVDLPPAGLMGIFLETEAEGVAAKGFSEGSGAEEAGIREGDRILSVGGMPINSYGDVRIALLNRKPKEKVTVTVLRDRVLLGAEQLTFEVELR